MSAKPGDGTHARWVAVTEEPHHHELFANAQVRVYEARIPPGATTLNHRHDTDTVYIIVRGGHLRSDSDGRHLTAPRLGRSTSLLRKLRWLTARLTTGWLDMPDATVLWQPHSARPLVHRVSAAEGNAHPIRMLGIELRTTGTTRSDRPFGNPELTSARSESHRVTGTSAGTAVPVPGQVVFTLVDGVGTAPDGSALRGGDTVWMSEPGVFVAPGPFLAVLTLV